MIRLFAIVGVVSSILLAAAPASEAAAAGEARARRNGFSSGLPVPGLRIGGTSSLLFRGRCDVSRAQVSRRRAGGRGSCRRWIC
jgi:hypothetical protein